MLAARLRWLHSGCQVAEGGEGGDRSVWLFLGGLQRLHWSFTWFGVKNVHFFLVRVGSVVDFIRWWSSCDSCGLWGCALATFFKLGGKAVHLRNSLPLWGSGWPSWVPWLGLSKWHLSWALVGVGRGEELSSLVHVHKFGKRAWL